MSDADPRIDRLYALLPVVYRQRDIAAGYPLRDLLRVIAEQVNVIEDDIASSYENWFIETCADWVVPYIGDLVGYQVVHTAADIEDAESQSRPLGRTLTPRRDVANYIRDLRRRGTLALLEMLANDSAGLSARAVEFFTLLGRTQSLNHLTARGALVDLRDGEALDLIDSPFDRLGHTIDVRGVNAVRTPGRHNIPSAGEYTWRLRSYPVTNAPAPLRQRGVGYFFHTFSQLGNNAPLFTNAVRELDPTTIANEINVPTPIRRRALELHRDDYYGLDAGGAVKSFAIWLGNSEAPVPAEQIVSANLSSWNFTPVEEKVFVDPELGLIAMMSDADLRVSYRYGFSGDVGAHESPRTLTQPRGAILYRIGANEVHATIADALTQWRADKPRDAVLEIADSAIYEEPFAVEIAENDSLQLRAANRCRPLLKVDGKAMQVGMNDGAHFTLDGLVVAGEPLTIDGLGDKPANVRVMIRRATLVPGWDIDEDCQPRSEKASLSLNNIRGTVRVRSSITGGIGVMDDTNEAEPLGIELSDSIIDATSNQLDAIVGPGGGYAWATLCILRCTLIGEVLVHAIDLAENSIFDAMVRVVRRQIGCMRFCYVAPHSLNPPQVKGDPPLPSRTPRRYHCQPDLVEQAVKNGPKAAALRAQEDRRVTPRFTSTRFGLPAYCQLAFDCAGEIRRGADDASEMGAFHDLFLPQRIANLRARLDQATPAGMETGIIFAD